MASTAMKLESKYSIRFRASVGGKSVRLQKHGKFGPLFVKEIAYTGRFTTMDGDEITLSEELLDDALTGSKVLMANGFSIRAFLDHDLHTSNDVAGTWMALWLTGRKLFGLIQAHGENMADKIAPLDTSLVLEQDIHVRDDIVVPMAITRIDVVPQGAVTGTQPFARLGRTDSNSRRRTMIRSALARLAGLAEGATLEQIAEALEAMDGEELDTEEMAARFRAALMPESDPESEPESDSEPEPESDSEPEPEPKDDAEMSARLSQARAEIRDLQGDKLDAELAEVENEADRKELRRQFNGLVKSGTPFSAAFSVIRTAVKLARANSDAPKTRTAARRGQPKRKNDSDIESARRRLFAAAERRGFKAAKGATK